MKLHDEFAAEGLVILAIHDGSIDSLEKMNEQLVEPKKQLWNDRDLPFRVALAGGSLTTLNGSQQNANASVVADYGIQEFPTSLLIDKQGKIVTRIAPHNQETNRRIIRELLESP